MCAMEFNNFIIIGDFALRLSRLGSIFGHPLSTAQNTHTDKSLCSVYALYSLLLFVTVERKYCLQNLKFFTT